MRPSLAFAFSLLATVAGRLWDQLWAESQTEVSQVLKTDMIQGLIDGSLDPQQFAAFLVNNVYYISRGPQTYLNALSRTRYDIDARKLEEYTP